MSKAAMNLQDSFLNQVRRENSEVRVLLVNGTLLRGTVKGFDNFTLILNNRNGQHLIYKHAVAQIVTHRAHLKPEEVTSTDDAAPAEGDTEKTESPARAPASEKPAHSEKQHRRHESSHSDNASKQKAKKEGFNTIDLSSVKLGDKR